MSDDNDKTEKPTRHRLEEARKKGQVVKSIECLTVLNYIVFATYCMFLFAHLWENSLNLTSGHLAGKYTFNGEIEELSYLLSDVTGDLLVIMGPFFAVITFGLIIAHLSQSGLIFSTEQLKLNWNKLSPIEGVKKIFTLKTLFGLLKSVLRILVVFVVLYFTGDSVLYNFKTLFMYDKSELIIKCANFVLIVIFTAILLQFPFAVSDYFFEKWYFLKKLRMSKHELKEEYKKREGDPKVKSKRKEIQKELMKNIRSISNVKNSDVVVVNPVHIAVALQYKSHSMEAPVILSKGRNLNASIIKMIAKAHNVPIVTNIKLARSLFSNGVVNSYIPEEQYEEVGKLFRMLVERNLVSI